MSARDLLDSIEPHFTKGGKLEKYYGLYEMVDTFIYTPSDVTRGKTHVRDGNDLKFKDPNNSVERTLTELALAGQAGVTYYLDDDAHPSIGSYYVLRRLADTVTAEEEDSGDSSGGSEVLIEAYATYAGDPGLTILPGGVWNLHVWAKTSGGPTSYLRAKVYKRASGGAETLLFTVTTPALDTSYTVSAIELISVQSDIVLNSTDLIVVKFYAYVTGGTTRTVYFLHNGTARYTHLVTPIPVALGNLETASYGSLYISSASDLAATTTPQKVAGTSTSLLLSNFDSPANCRLRYTGAVTKKFQVTLTASLNSSDAKTAYLTLAKSGATIAASEERGYCDSGRMQPISLTYQIELVQNEYIEPFIRVDSGTATISALLHMSIHAL